ETRIRCSYGRLLLEDAALDEVSQPPSRDLAATLPRRAVPERLEGNRVGVFGAGGAVYVRVVVPLPRCHAVGGHVLAHGLERRLRPCGATALEQLAHEASPESEMAGLVAVVHAVD